MDQAGKIRGGRTDRLTMNLRPEPATRVAESAIRLVNRIELPPGRYRLRWRHAIQTAGKLVPSSRTSKSPITASCLSA